MRQSYFNWRLSVLWALRKRHNIELDTDDLLDFSPADNYHVGETPRSFAALIARHIRYKEREAQVRP